MEEIKLQIFQNGVLWKIFGCNTNNANGNREYYIMKNFMMSFGSYTCRTRENKKSYRIPIGKQLGKRLLVRVILRGWYDNNEIDFTDMPTDYVNGK